MRTIEAIAADIDAGSAVSREEAEAVIRAVGKTCRGALSPKALAAKNAALADADHDHAKTIDTVGRKPCGFDFNETILAGELDGQDHEYECPRCQVTGTYRAPKIAIAEEVN
jgi:hypothetical protein